MDLIELWTHFKEFFVDLVTYGFPTVAILLSIISYIESRKANKVQDRLNIMEEKLKKYELEEKEKEREESTKASIEARIMKISKRAYKMKVWNSGKAIAYNVDFVIPPEHSRVVSREKVPYEFLEPGKSFEEHVSIDWNTPSKFKVITTWENKQGISQSKEQILTI